MDETDSENEKTLTDQELIGSEFCCQWSGSTNAEFCPVDIFIFLIAGHEVS